MFSIAVLATCVLMFGISVSRTMLKGIFADWGAELPFSTQVAFSDWTISASSLLFILTFVKELFVKHEASSRGWNEMVILVAVIFGFVYAMAALLPFVTPLQSLS
jgi:hypothetical protein